MQTAHGTIQMLPPELLTSIFSCACSQNDLRAAPLAPALALSRVCNIWREIMLSSPRLWSSLKIHLSRSSWPRERLPELRRQVMLFMERSESELLSLEVYFLHTDSGAHTLALSTLEMEPAWSTLASQSHRWMSIHLGMAGKLLFVEPCFRTIRGRLNSLKHVSISVHRNRYPADDDDVIELFNACPSLESVILDFDDIDIFAFPYDQIKSLTIRSGSNESTMELLRECRNMEELFVGGLRTIGGNLFGGSFTSSKLRKLTVEAAVYTKTVHFEFPFSNYTVENLASLTLADFKSEPGCWDKFEVPPVADFLTRSRCSITTLVIKWLPITDAQAVQLIQLMPALGSLYVGEYHHEGGHELDNSVVTKDFLDALSLTPKESTKELNTSPLASHLTELTLVVHGQDLDQEALINMLVSRKSQDSLEAEDEADGLRTVTISFIGEIESSFMHRLQGSSLHDRTRPWVEITRVSINTDPWRSLLL